MEISVKDLLKTTQKRLSKNLKGLSKISDTLNISGKHLNNDLLKALVNCRAFNVYQSRI